MKNKIISLLLCLMLVILMLPGCTKSKKENAADGGEYDGTPAKRSTDTKSLTDSTSGKAEDYMAKADSDGMDMGLGITSSESSIGEVELRDEYEVPDEVSASEPQELNSYTAGLLTAGEWEDNKNWGFLINLVRGGHIVFPSFTLNPLSRIVVNVSDGGTQVKNAKVTLQSENGNEIWSAVTNYDGIAYVYFNVVITGENPANIIVEKNGKIIEASVETEEAEYYNAGLQNEDVQDEDVQDEDVQNGDEQRGFGLTKIEGQISNTNINIDLQDTPTDLSLDLMFVFDTTGSMSDELLYLQKEFEDIANCTSEWNTRYSVNFYRDKGDAYVVKSNKFTTDSALVQKQLNSEYSDGGGDFPEAVDLALIDAVYDHDWKEDSVKLLFIILDAPPHKEPEVYTNLQNVIKEASKLGIRIIPIASSGIDKDTEVFLRTTAMITGGTYVFLTDHSGIGNSHLEPTIGSYEVEKLNDCIVRLINQYCN